MGNSRSKSAKAKSGSSKGKGEAPAKSNEEEAKSLADAKPAEGQETPTAAVEENSGQDTITPASEDTGQPRAEETTPVVEGEKEEEEGVADQSVAVEKEEVVVVAAAAVAASSEKEEEEETVAAAEAKHEEVESCGDPRPPSEVGDGDGRGPLPDAGGGDGDESPVPPSDGDVGVSGGCDADGGGADGGAVIQEEHADRVCAEVDSVPTSPPAAHAECDEEVPQMEDSVPAAVIGDSNGTEPEPQTVTEDTSQYVPRLCNLCKWPDFDGYGFNLHAEKEKPGQYIGIVDPDSPADLGGLKEGDRIIEVNGENIEASNHTVVIQKIKSKGDKTSMLVVDKATDDYFKRQGQTVCSSMTSVVVISTPPRLAVVDTTMNQQDTVQAAAAVDNVVVPQGAAQVAAAAVDTGIEQQDAAQVSAAHHDWVSTTVEEQTSGVVDLESAEEDFPAPPQALTAAEWDVGEDTGLPEPNVSLSDSEETGDRVTAVVAEQVESAPVPDEVQAVQNGTEEVAEGVATVCVEGEAEVAPPEEIVGGGGVVDYHPYEEVDVTATTAAAATTTVVSSYQEEAGTATNGMNGGSVGEAAVVSQTSEAEPAVIHSTTTTTTTTITTGGAADGDLNLNLSAAEMKERLKMRKKQDPRHSKTSFETKYKMFEKM